MDIMQRYVDESHELVLFGDEQVGNLLSHTEAVHELVDYIASRPSTYAIHMGDEMDAFWVDDKRFSIDTTISTPLQQQREVVRTYAPIAKSGQLFTILFGNHSARLLPKIGDITATTCKDLGIQYSGFSTVLEMYSNRTNQLLYKVFATHGKRSVFSAADDPIRQLSNMKLQLKRHLYPQAGDCLIMAKGHTHKLIVAEPEPILYMTHNNGKIKQHYTDSIDTSGQRYIDPDLRWYVNTGSFLKSRQLGVNSYPEMAEYAPVQLGYAVVEALDGMVMNIRTERV